MTAEMSRCAGVVRSRPRSRSKSNGFSITPESSPRSRAAVYATWKNSPFEIRRSASRVTP